MLVTDPIADMLTRIRNALQVRHDNVLVPSSKMKMAIAKTLKEEGFIEDYEVVRGKHERMIKIHLKYTEGNEPMITGLERISKPGLRVYARKREVPMVFGGLGVAIISTSRGVVTGQQSKRMGVGGEVLCYVW